VALVAAREPARASMPAPGRSRVPAVRQGGELARPSQVPVTQPEDAVEREADLLAGHGRLRGGQRSPVPLAPASAWAAIASPGRALLPSEASCAPGLDVAGIRVHTGSVASGSARELHASAYTLGDHVVFGDGVDTASADGRRMLAHELVHVAQGRREGALRVARRPMPGHPDMVEFREGIEIDAKLARAARAVAAGGVTLDELRGLRAVALADETIDHEERGFLAGLLDPANAAQVAKGGRSFAFSRASIAAHLAEVADLDRPRVDQRILDAFWRKWSSVVSGDPDAAGREAHEEATLAHDQMLRLVKGEARWEQPFRKVLAFASGHHVEESALLVAMVSSASDSTVGDMVLAATAYAVAVSANHPMAGDLLSGRLKVDQLSDEHMTKGLKAEAAYMPTASATSGLKGDTLYLKEHLDIDDPYRRSSIVHELTHAQQDKRGTDVAVVDEEWEAYRAQAAYLLPQLAPLRGRERDQAVQSAKLMDPVLFLALVLEVTHAGATADLWSVLLDINDAKGEFKLLSREKLAGMQGKADEGLVTSAAKNLLAQLYKVTPDAVEHFQGLTGEYDLEKM
jgi:hypothetical protein